MEDFRHRVGSSPLARGLLDQEVAVVQRPGIIPARAGFTLGDDGIQTVWQDHPRSRGVYLRLLRGRWRRVGSSPLARGLRRYRIEGTPDGRIIPARAGFTHRDGQGLPPRGDHPRSRGVYPDMSEPAPIRPGSSPLARGLLPAVQRSGPGVRIIPARAGFTELHIRLRAIDGDHPRSRGVYACQNTASTGTRGSSPLARGLLIPAAFVSHSSGIIPARAGFTTRAWAGSLRSPDHPRSRGVYRRAAGAGVGRGGSSPLARGLPSARVCGSAH